MSKTVRNEREKTILRTGAIGIGANLALAASKAAIGLAANSVAVIADAVNNLSDALSSIITIAGAKLAGKAPDKQHPMGHGRIEYMSALIVSAIVLYAGITTVIDSVKKIITPVSVDYSAVSLVVLGIAVAVKVVLGLYTKSKGKAVNSGSLTASGADALNDAVLSTSVLLSAAIHMIWHVSIEAWVGAVIGLYIIRSGIGMIYEAVNEMLGTRAGSELTAPIKAAISAFPEVHGVYDLFLNNFGPETYIASVHVELDDAMTAREIDALTRRIQNSVYQETGVIVAAVGVYSVNSSDAEACRLREDVRARVMSHEGVLQFHGFYADEKNKSMSFDVVLDFSVKDREALYSEIEKEIREAYPDYSVRLTKDLDISD
ncbi:MAG: cation diffusion facilitator family transporter [Clostridia bacterium]|nr:cation diffusion facilitator family transporter [Clostridia bacterium]